MSSSSGPVVIVGAGHAAVQAIDTLRREGFDGPITLVGDESTLPYNRPPLSKRYFAGDIDRRQLLLRDESFYTSTATELRLGVTVVDIDRRNHRVQLDDGNTVSYAQLLLCTGSRVRRLQVDGETLKGIHFLRTVADVDGIRAELAAVRRLVVVGAGYIGLEAAASARKLGLEVTVLEMSDRPLNRVVAPQVSSVFSDWHSRQGVTILCNAGVQGFIGDAGGRVRAVLCSGREFPADLVIVGIGVLPETSLAEAAGLECVNGVRVDETCLTSDANIRAAGDCTNHPSLRYGRRVRLESVDNALEQARVAAMNFCGKTARHDHVPWFWSDQYELKLQIAGLSQGYDRTVLRGDSSSGRFALFYFSGEELIAADAINSPKEFMFAKRWIAERKRPDIDKLGDPSVDIKTI